MNSYKLRKAILMALGTASLAGISQQAAAVDPINIGAFTGTALTYHDAAPYRAWSEHGATVNYGWTHTAHFVSVQIGGTDDIAAGKVLDVTLDVSARGSTAPMDFPGFSVWTSGTALLVAGSANGDGYGHKWSQVRGPNDGGVADDPCGKGKDCSLGSNGWLGVGGGGNIVSGHDGWIGYANAGYSFANGDGDKIQGRLPGNSNSGNQGQYGGGSTDPLNGTALTNVNAASSYVRGGQATLNSGDAKLTLYGLKAGYYLLGIGGSCPDDDLNGQNCTTAPAGGASREFTLTIDAAPNTAPAYADATTAFRLPLNSPAVDLKASLHAKDPDSNQTLTWTQATAPDHGGTLTITGATAASGGADISPGGTITYQPAPGFTGTETFAVQVGDGTGTQVRTFTVTVVEASFLGNGAFDRDDRTQLFSFTTDGAAPVTLRTASYAKGGFDPILTLFDAWGRMVDPNGKGYLNDDGDNGGACSLATADPATGLCLDSVYQGTLPAGKYWLVLAVSNNYANSADIGGGFAWDGKGDITGSQFECANASGGFYDYECHQRTGVWSVEFFGTQAAQTETAFAVSANQAPGFVGGAAPVSLSIPPAQAVDLKPQLHIQDGDAGQTKIWSPAALPLHGKLSLSADATATAGGDDVTPGGTLTYTPNPGYAGPDSFAVQVSDGIASATRQFVVSVVENLIAKAGPDQTVNPGQTVTLDGSTSSGPEGITLGYRWTQRAGDPAVAYLTGAGANTAKPQFIAPKVNAETVLGFDLVVTDGGTPPRASSADTVLVTVRKSAVGVPTANAGKDFSATGGGLVLLDGSASSDPDSGQTATLKYRWTAPTGIALSDTASPKPSFTAPATAGTYSFQLVVTDSDGNASAPAAVAVTVKKANTAPEAQTSAVGGGSVRPGAVKTLDGSASFDADSDPLTYAWTQTLGPSVALSGAQDAKPSFTAPLEAAGQTLVFALKVNDGQTDSAASAVTVQVDAGNNPPTVSIIAEPVKEGAEVTLNATISDPDGDGIASYRWQQVGGAAVTPGKTDGPSLTFTAPMVGSGSGELSFSLTVTDDYAAAPASAQALATLRVDNDPGKLDCSGAFPSRKLLWPPNKGMVPVTVGGVAGPVPVQVSITGVASDEPVRDKAAKDKTGPDAKIKRNGGGVSLRAERQMKQKNGAGSGNGRVYTVDFSASAQGQSCQGSVAVQVPAQSGVDAVDDGSRFDATRRK